MTVIGWGHGAIAVELTADADGPLWVSRLWVSRPADSDPDSDPAPRAAAGRPAVEVLTVADGRHHASQRLVNTLVGERLRYVEHTAGRVGDRHELRVRLAEDGGGLAAELLLTSTDGVAAVTATVTVRNTGTAPRALLGVPSLALRVAIGPGAMTRPDDLDLVRGASDWLGEGRWSRQPLREAGLVDLSLAEHGQNSRGQIAVRSLGTWSTGHRMPVGALVDRTGGAAWMWQVEHNGPWRFEVGDDLAGTYLAMSGPTDLDHQFSRVLAAGAEFTSVPVTLAVGVDLDAAVAALTAHRRASRRPHADRAALGVVFNDYMNTLDGDPTTAKLLPLVDAAAEVGAEYFCIDAGWYDDTGEWWDSVGEWRPSTTRFPNGLGEVLDRIRGHGMVPGLWLEPEVVGVRSALELPPGAFLSRHGERLVENSRYHLDLRHPAARSHLDAVVDRLVGELGVGYLKLDYNIDPGPGTDTDTDSVGAALLAHNRAHLAWLDGVLDRHPGLVLENCSSGAMRADHAMLSRLQLQSTTDQQDPLYYPAIAAAAPMGITPEQAANWAYPQPEMTDEEIAFALCTGLLGRLYLSGHVDLMSAAQRAIVAEAVTAYKSVRADLATSTPSWPLGLPRWDAPWLALALHGVECSYVTVWRRPGSTSAEIQLDLPALRGRDLVVEPLFPTSLDAWSPTWAAHRGVLTVKAGAADTAARTLRLRTT